MSELPSIHYLAHGEEQLEQLHLLPAIDLSKYTCQLHKMSAQRAFTAQNTEFSGRNRVWLKFTASEDRPHAPTVVFSPSFPLPRE